MPFGYGVIFGVSILIMDFAACLVGTSMFFVSRSKSGMQIWNLLFESLESKHLETYSNMSGTSWSIILRPGGTVFFFLFFHGYRDKG